MFDSWKTGNHLVFAEKLHLKDDDFRVLHEVFVLTVKISFEP